VVDGAAVTKPALAKPDHCKSCIGWEWGHDGYVPLQLPTSMSRWNGVLMVFEAAGEDEAKAGTPMVGRAGWRLAQMLQRGGMRREDFPIHNVLSCRPPNNKLANMPWEDAAIGHCTPNLDASIDRLKPKCILAGGGVALERLGGPKGILKARGYVFWSNRYSCWVIGTYHPSFIMRGNHKLEGVFIHDVQRAVEIARDGHQVADPRYLLDPTPMAFAAWVRDYKQALLANRAQLLSVDIETPGKDEDEGELDIDSEVEASILRIGFSYEPYTGVSIPWQGPYIAGIKELLAASGSKLWWNKSFDYPRLVAAGMSINGTSHDGMVAWHVLNSDIPKSLGFVATFCCPDQPMWKHLAHEKPAFYNCTDVDVALRNMLRIETELRKVGMWDIYDRYVLQLDPVLSQMSANGMPIDHEKRRMYAAELAVRQADVLERMRKVVPLEALNHSPKGGYVKEPEDKTGMTSFVSEIVVKRCSNCGEENPKKPHFRTLKTRERPCAGAEKVDVKEHRVRWARAIPFVPSNVQILNYQRVMKHQPVMRGRGVDRKPTTDENAIKSLMIKYKDNPLYPLVLEYRELDKLGGTYIGRPE
jgi:DNA polymerase